MSEGEPLFAFDASVFINLLGSGIPDRFIEALGGRILVAEQVFREVYNDPGRRISPQAWLKQIRDRGWVEIITLSGDALLKYLEFAAGGLDDGEAATLALAIHQGAVAVIDEKRARQVCVSQYPELGLSSTAELFRELQRRGAVPPEIVRTALFDALRVARMRVIPEMTHWVISMIGIENARQCSSISKASIRRFEEA